MTAVPERQRYALQTIFSFFLGLMVAAFVGVGVNTFYPSPATVYEQQMQEINRRQEDISRKGDPKGNIDAADQAELNKIYVEQRALQDKIQAATKPWMRNTSIVVILFATGVMALSLVRSEQLKVLSNGLLLGGLFTMLYGIGWVIASGESIARFSVMVFALAVTVALGYVRFVRNRRPLASPAEAETAAPEVAALTARVDALEARFAAAAAALAPDERAG